MFLVSGLTTFGGLGSPTLNEGTFLGIPPFEGSSHVPNINAGIMTYEGMLFDILEVSFMVKADLEQFLLLFPCAMWRAVLYRSTI